MENIRLDENSKDSNEETLGKVETPVIADEKISHTGGVQTVPYILNGELYEILSRNGENVTVKCCSCPSGRFYRGSVRSTGNFHMHIKRRHPYLLGRLHAMKVHSLLERRDRLMKNRKAKLRILVNNKGIKGEHEQHKLKIKRAFQRHQAEAKGNEQSSFQELTPTDLSTASNNFHDDVPDCRQNNNVSFDQDESLQIASTQSSDAACPIADVSSENALCELQILNVAQLNPSQLNTTVQQSPPVTPYPSTLSCDSNVFGKYNPTIHSQLKGAKSFYIETPLDLSCHTRSSSPIGNSYDRRSSSSGIGLEPMWSKTTVENSLSAANSFNNELGNQNSSHIDCGDAVCWQQRLESILHEIHNDIRARNRIEQNRLLLEIAELKYLHPGFCFNLQE